MVKWLKLISLLNRAFLSLSKWWCEKLTLVLNFLARNKKRRKSYFIQIWKRVNFIKKWIGTPIIVYLLQTFGPTLGLGDNWPWYKSNIGEDQNTGRNP